MIHFLSRQVSLAGLEEIKQISHPLALRPGRLLRPSRGIGPRRHRPMPSASTAWERPGRHSRFQRRGCPPVILNWVLSLATRRPQAMALLVRLDWLPGSPLRQEAYKRRQHGLKGCPQAAGRRRSSHAG